MVSLPESAQVSLHGTFSSMAPLEYQHLQCKVIVKDMRPKCKTQYEMKQFKCFLVGGKMIISIHF